MQVTITAKCTYCARKFNATPGLNGRLICEDFAGRLCCPDCYCPCGYGHPTAEDERICRSEFFGGNTPDEGYFDATYADEAARFDDWRSESVA